MKKATSLLVLALMSCLAWADVIVLANGKQMIIDGSYEIKGSYVVFKDKTGNLVQLPLKIVDLDKSKEATAEYAAHLEEKAKQAAAKVEEEEKEGMSMSEIAEIIDAKRPKDQPPPRVVLGNDRLEKYAEEQPLPQNDAMPVVDFEPLKTPEGMREARVKFHESYTKLSKELAELEVSLESSITYADALAQESSFGDDPTGGTFQAMERADKAVEELRNKKKEKEDQLKQLEDSARRAGVRNYKNKSRGRN